MRVIGIRVKPTEIIYSIIDSVEEKIIVVDRLHIPKALSLPDQLSHVRKNMIDIFSEYEIKNAGIRLPENNARKIDLRRTQIESVLLEMFASCELENYYVGQIATIASKVGINRADFKKYINDEIDYDSVENWSSHKLEEKEAILTAMGALNV